MANFVLMRSGYLPVSVKYEDRADYYAAFTAYHRDGDLTPMIRIFAKAESARLTNALAAVHPHVDSDSRSRVRRQATA